MIELSSVEWDHNFKCYVATLSDGEVLLLDSDNLREAEQEAQRVIEQYHD
jgi:SepF-like predicted cell division protein (DUF552 family)